MLAGGSEAHKHRVPAKDPAYERKGTERLK